MRALGIGAMLMVIGSPLVAQRRDVGRMLWDGRDRTYIVRTPQRLDPARPAPLVIVLHGFGGSGDLILAQSGFDTKADAEGFLVVAPDGTGDPPGWRTVFSFDFTDDVGFIGAIIDSVTRRYPVDPRRIYVAGYSNGGRLAHHVAADLSSRIAAAAVVAGLIGARTERGQVNRIEPPRAPVPMLIIHGDADAVVPYTGGRPIPAPEGGRFWVRANECRSLEPRADTLGAGRVVRETWDIGCRAPVVFLTIRGGDHDWPSTSRGAAIDAAETIWEFFQQQERR